jgi:DNA-binding transcriptional regulator YiaG
MSVPTAHQDGSNTPPRVQMRNIRVALELSQRRFAARLSVSSESYRAWESGRRAVPEEILRRVGEFARADQPRLPLPLASLARVLGVSLMTLRNAARSGRLSVVRDAPAALGKPILRAWKEDGEAFLTNHYRRAPHWNSRRQALTALPRAPTDYAKRVLRLRSDLQLSQRGLAIRLGAAGRAVVYQWEAGKRRPSPVLWLRLLALGA